MGSDIPLRRLERAGTIQDKYGCWPLFHDSEILTIALDRVGPSITLDILMTPIHGQHFRVSMSFQDIDDLEIAAFNHQNVIASLSFSERIERRFGSGEEQNRLLVEIASVFGAVCSFSCANGEVLSLVETPLRIGHPPSVPRGRP